MEPDRIRADPLDFRGLPDCRSKIEDRISQKIVYVVFNLLSGNPSSIGLLDSIGLPDCAKGIGIGTMLPKDHRPSVVVCRLIPRDSNTP